MTEKAKDEKATSDSLANKFAMLSQVNHMTNSAQLGALHGQSEDMQQRTIAGIIQNLRDLLATDEEGSHLYESFDRPLTANEYVLPPELAHIHPELVAHLSSDKTNEALRHSGIALYGTPGTGKTQYVRFLQSCAPQIRVVTGNNNLIRNAHSPGMALRNLYKILEKEAERLGVYMVLLFDEFEKLINKHARVHRTTERKSTEQSSEKRSHSHTEQRTVDDLTMDDAGEELLSELKTILSGTGGIQRVFTVCTTNQMNIPAELTRSERLRPIRMDTIGMHVHRSTEAHHKFIPVYDEYRRILPLIIDILNSAHFRLQKADHATLQSIRAEVISFFQSHRTFEDYKNEHVPVKQFGHNTTRETFLENNFQLLKDLLEFLGYDYDRLGHFRSQDQFGGAMEGGRHSSWVFDGPYREAEQMDAMTPAWLAGFYKEHTGKLENMESAKQTLARLIFPQLPEEPPKATEQAE